MQYIFFYGSRPTLSRLELTTLLDCQLTRQYHLSLSTDKFAIIDLPSQLDNNFITTLGGTTRVAATISRQTQPFSTSQIASFFSPPPQQKISVGLSGYGPTKLNLRQQGLALKKYLRQQGIRLNFIIPAGNASHLNAAQVIFNHLTRSPNCELNLIETDQEHILARTTQVQDIAAYELRDTRRPTRDTSVGLLPPKLAQIMLNLVPSFNPNQPTIYDPYCGMGTILQEAWLKKIVAFGSDHASDMVTASINNLNWLSDNFPLLPALRPTVFTHDIRRPLPPTLTNKFDAVVTEPYLGPPLNHPLTPAAIKQRQQKLRSLYLSSLRRFRPTLVSHGWVVMVFPAFLDSNHQYVIFPTATVDAIAATGYIIKHLGSSSRGELYARQDACVAREITLWQKSN